MSRKRSDRLIILIQTKYILSNLDVWISHKHIQSFNTGGHRVFYNRFDMNEERNSTNILYVVVVGSETPWLRQSLTT